MDDSASAGKVGDALEGFDEPVNMKKSKRAAEDEDLDIE